MYSKTCRRHRHHYGQCPLQYEAALAVDAIKLFTRAFYGILRKDNDFLQDAVTSRGDKVIKCTDDSEVRTGPGVKILEEMKAVRFLVYIRFLVELLVCVLFLCKSVLPHESTTLVFLELSGPG